ncbi:hypothetical protein IEQ_04911 [Bacillus cereus BAG6X1-2]|nr:hypothetical protein IEQ_04911 [Bacillus cereus BAG6X1-2]
MKDSKEFKRIQYVRYADDFLIGIIGSKKDAETIKKDLTLFLQEKLLLELSQEKTLITHSSKTARFLGYDISIEIRIEYVREEDTNKDIDMQLYWETDKLKKEILPQKYIFSTDSSKKERTAANKSLANKNLFGYELSDDEEEENIDLDTDDDSIPDVWEMKGYTIKGMIAVEWKDSLTAQGYKKYVSNPFKSNTAGDPYTDYEKAANKMDSATNKVARNPLVASYPSIGITMDNFTISKNNDISQTTGEDTSTSLTKGTSNSTTYETSKGIDVTATESVEVSMTPSASVSLSVSKTFNESNSTTATVDESTTASTGNTWSESIGINTAESAYLGARVRYINTGTAPAYQLKPDVTLGMGTNHTLTSGIVDEKYKANILNPDSVFPKKESLPILVNKHENMPISINFDQLKELEKKKELRLDSTQYDAVVSPNGIGAMEKWEKFTNDIEHTTAKMIFVTPDEAVERRIAAQTDPTDPEDKNPEIDVEQALEIGFEKLKKTETGYQYGDYTFDKLHMIYDEDTAEKFKEQASHQKDEKLDPNKMKLNAKMNMQISPDGLVTNTKTKKTYYFENGRMADFYDGAEDNSNPLGEWTNSKLELDGKNSNSGIGNYYSYGDIGEGTSYTTLFFKDEILKKINPNAKYNVSVSLKEDPLFPNPPENKMVKIQLLDESGLSFATEQSLVDSTGYRRTTIASPFSSGKMVGIRITFVGYPGRKAAIRMDDLAITEVGVKGKLEDVIKIQMKK